MAVFMDTVAVQEMADSFEQAAEFLEGVAKFLDGLIMILKTTAFMGFVGGMAYERYLSTLKPQIESLAEYCHEIHTDLEDAIQRYIAGDEEGASRFF